MHHRIGALHLHYRVADDALVARVPAFDRTVQGRLAEAIEARIATQLGDDASVVVVRELASSVVLAGPDAVLDRRIVARVCDASVDALVHALSRDEGSDAVVRFADEAAFIGAFIVELLAGVAWSHWYFGAFRKHRRATVEATIRAVLDDTTQGARVFAWLSRHGQLERLLASLRPGALIAALRMDPGGERVPETADGTDAIASAAFDLLAALGVEIAALDRVAFVHRWRASGAAVFDWRDRRALSECVLDMMRLAYGRAFEPMSPLPTSTAAVRALLAGRLDWLDGEWLARQLDAPDATHVEATADVTVVRPRLDVRNARILEQVAMRVRDGERAVSLSEGIDAIFVRLLAIAADALAPGETPDRALLAAIEDIARIVAVAKSGRVESSLDAGTTPTPVDTHATEASEQRLPSTTAIDALMRHGKAAVTLARALAEASDETDAIGEATANGGLFLLLRGLMDARLTAMAREFGVPTAPLLGALAHRWFAPCEPFDSATSLWVGEDHCDFAALDAARDGLHAMNAALLEVLAQRDGSDESAIRGWIEADAQSMTPLPCPGALNVAVSRTGSTMLRIWSAWLRGVAGSSSAFLLKNCLRRTGRVRITDRAIHVDLDPAPLDIVLRMAGYLQPIEGISWLGDRRVTFTVRHAAQR